MQRMYEATLDRAAGGDQRLSRDLPAEHALALFLRALAAKNVHLDLLEIEDGDERVDRGLRRMRRGVGHGRRRYQPGTLTASSNTAA